jgi:hypothetical protein
VNISDSEQTRRKRLERYYCRFQHSRVSGTICATPGGASVGIDTDAIVALDGCLFKHTFRLLLVGAARWRRVNRLLVGTD